MYKSINIHEVEKFTRKKGKDASLLREPPGEGVGWSLWDGFHCFLKSPSCFSSHIFKFYYHLNVFMFEDFLRVYNEIW